MPRPREVTLLPEALKQWRKVRGHSQLDLARATGTEADGGVSESMIAAIEAGRRQPTYRNARRLAEALQVPVTALAIIHIAADADGRTPSIEALRAIEDVA